MELGRRALVGLQRQREVAHDIVGMLEHIVAGRAEGVPEQTCVRGLRDAAAQRHRAGVGHLVSVEQRDPRLVVQRVDAAVPGQSARGRRIVRIAPVVVVEAMLDERNRVLQVEQRGRGARPLPTVVRAAELHGQGVGRRERMARIVAGRAGQLARGRQAAVEEGQPPDGGQLPDVGGRTRRGRVVMRLRERPQRRRRHQQEDARPGRCRARRRWTTNLHGPLGKSSTRVRRLVTVCGRAVTIG